MADRRRFKRSEYTTNNRVKFVHGGEEYFTLLHKLINTAEHTIHIQVYIFNHDETGTAIAESLVAAAKRGVNVYFLVDGYASQSLTTEMEHQFKEAGVNFSEFEPLFRSKSFYFGRRMHHKVVVVDGYSSLVGGLNFADRYNDVQGIPAWLDYAVHIEGEASDELQFLCCNMWNKYSVSCKAQPGMSGKERIGEIPSDEKCSVRVRRNDWVKGRNSIWKSYFDMFNHSSDSIIIMCSYFLPGLVFRARMEKAVRKGVKIKLITSGRSDVMIAKYAERFLYRWILRNKIELYEYDKNVLHAKIAVQDNKWMTIGSYNVNNISAYAAIELNLDIRNKPFVNAVEDELEKIIAEDCTQITEENFKRSINIFKQFLYRVSYEFIRVTLYVFTFYFKKEE